MNRRTSGLRCRGGRERQCNGVRAGAPWGRRQVRNPNPSVRDWIGSGRAPGSWCGAAAAAERGEGKGSQPGRVEWGVDCGGGAQ